jgi:DNA-binding transcriptional LysR family regulator
MELIQLTYFCAVAGAGGFRKACANLMVSQPALSQQIKRLEAELGVELFDRGSRPIALTDAGAFLYGRAQQLLADVELTASQLHEFSGEFRGKVVLGAMQYLTFLALPEVIASFRQAHPLVELQLKMGNTGQLQQMLRSGEVDLILCHADNLSVGPKIHVRELRSEELVIIVAEDHPLASCDRISVPELADAHFITFGAEASIHQALLDAFAEYGRSPRIDVESADMTTAFALVERGLGVALVPRSIVGSAHVRPLPLYPRAASRRLALVWRENRYALRAVKSLAEHIEGSVGRTAHPDRGPA